ncbi:MULTISPECIES: GbsR/MarR family transcriptional regulator [Streptomyces]|uniref:GbsR/MarR family transcriptional regulator n=1 Tax=Streptomyces TaxID=1883 RepID=UPI002E144654|nr:MULTISPECIES: helix-turn-helix domain-containing protein [Streptomyces]WSS02030.1 MarR family transcriptional regulator [Streptomyces goshikiensis]
MSVEKTPQEAEAVSEFVERFASELAEAGMQMMPARIFSCLMAEDSGVLTSAELSERLHVSPAAVSGAIGYLARVGLVSREREPGSRRDRYRVRNNAWFESMAQRDELMLRWIRVLNEGVDTIGGGTPAGQRLAESSEFFEFLMNELTGVLARWRALQSQQAARTP